jgi:hypothetical protein
MKSGCRSCALAAATSNALGINHRKITLIALRYSASIRAWAHTKLIRQIVLTVTGTELKSSHAASFVMPAAANQRQAPSSRCQAYFRQISAASSRIHDPTALC